METKNWIIIFIINEDSLIQAISHIVNLIVTQKLSKRAISRGVLLKNKFLKVLQNSEESTCARVSFLLKLQTEACNFINKVTLAQVYSCEFGEIFKNTFFGEHL